MGSFNMNCSITSHPFQYGQNEAVLIPLLVRLEQSAKPVYTYENVLVFPLFVECKYYDYGMFHIEETEISKTLLAIVARTLSRDESFTWEEFFKLSHENHTVNEYRLSYAAIHKSVFENIINNYKIHGRLDDSITEFTSYNYANYGFEHFLRKKLKLKEIVKMETEKEIQLQQYKIDEAIKKGSNQSLIDILKMEIVYRAESLVKYKYMNLEPNYFIDGQDLLKSDESLKNYMKVQFIGRFLDGIGKPWQESVYAGQEVDNIGFKVLRNSIAELTVSAWETYVEENVLSPDEPIIDELDQQLIDTMNRLHNITPEYEGDE